MIKTSFLLIFIILLFYKSFGQKYCLEISLEKISEDIVNVKNESSLDYIKRVDKCRYSFYYLQNFCFIHIPNFSNKYFCSEPTSILLIYQCTESRWELVDFFPFCEEIELIDSVNRIFISNNSITNPVMSNSSYFEISQFNGKKMNILESYYSFNNKVFLYGLLQYDKFEEIEKYIGDTIRKEYFMSDIATESAGLKSFNQRVEIEIFEGYINDSLICRELKNEKKIFFK